MNGSGTLIEDGALEVDAFCLGVSCIMAPWWVKYVSWVYDYKVNNPTTSLKTEYDEDEVVQGGSNNDEDQPVVPTPLFSGGNLAFAVSGRLCTKSWKQSSEMRLGEEEDEDKEAFEVNEDVIYGGVATVAV